MRKWKERIDNRRQERKVKKDNRLNGIDVMDDELDRRYIEEENKRRVEGTREIENFIVICSTSSRLIEKKYYRPKDA